jgi:hypothetical protein
VAQIDDGHDVAALEVAEGEVGELPIIFADAQPGSMDRRAIAQIADAHFVDEREIGAPMLVMAAAVHLVDAGTAAVDRRHAVLDSGREHEGGHQILLTSGLLNVAGARWSHGKFSAGDTREHSPRWNA